MESQKYYSQFGEDKILNKIFKKKVGVCIEVGGFDGITGSNTYFFENLGWRCLIVEPMPDFCQKIRHTRNCEVAEIAASDKAGEVEFYVATGVETLSTIEESDKHFARIRSLSDSEIKKIKVKTARLDDILFEHKITEVDFMTIDVEGHEMSVLLGMKFDAITPRIIILEDNSNGEDSSVNKFMESVGYKRFKRTGCNDWYAKKEDELVMISQCMQTEIFIFCSVVWRKFKAFAKEFIQ